MSPNMRRRQARLLHLVDPDHGDAGPVPVAAGDPRSPARAWAKPTFARLGLAHSVPGLGAAAGDLGLDSAAPERNAGVPEDEGRGHDVPSAPLTEAFANGAMPRSRILALFGVTGEAVVWYCGQFYALFFLPRAEGRRLHRATADRWSLLLGTPASSSLRLAVRQDRPQADHPGWLPARGVDLSSRSSR